MSVWEVRLREFVASRVHDLHRALAIAHGQGVPEHIVPIDHLRENVLGFLLPHALEGPELGLQWGLRVTLHRERGDSMLSDLVWSLACEQHPSHRVSDFDERRARSTSDALVGLHFDAVEAFVRSRFPDLGDRSTDVAVETFSRAFLTYWSARATSRFRGGARLRSFLCAIARSCALAELGDTSEDVQGEPRDDEPRDHETGGTDAPVSAPSGTADLAGALADCIERLPPKRRIVASHRWLQGKRSSEVATDLGMQRPAVSNHLARSLPVLQKCLAEKGIDRQLEAG